MRYPIAAHWEKVKKDFIQCQKTSMGLVQIASVDEFNHPCITPIGSLFLGEKGQAFFCNRFPKNLNKNLQTNDRICVLATNRSKWFWMKSLFRGRFTECPGIKLYGRIGARRKITDAEKNQWERLVNPYRWMKGYDLIWKGMNHASDIRFEYYEYLNVGKMTPDMQFGPVTPEDPVPGQK